MARGRFARETIKLCYGLPFSENGSLYITYTYTCHSVCVLHIHIYITYTYYSEYLET